MTSEQIKNLRTGLNRGTLNGAVVSAREVLIEFLNLMEKDLREAEIPLKTSGPKQSK